MALVPYAGICPERKVDGCGWLATHAASEVRSGPASVSPARSGSEFAAYRCGLPHRGQLSPDTPNSAMARARSGLALAP
jgi:hypothetical protein